MIDLISSQSSRAEMLEAKQAKKHTAVKTHLCRVHSGYHQPPDDRLTAFRWSAPSSRRNRRDAQFKNSVSRSYGGFSNTFYLNSQLYLTIHVLWSEDYESSALLWPNDHHHVRQSYTSTTKTYKNTRYAENKKSRIVV